MSYSDCEGCEFFENEHCRKYGKNSRCYKHTRKDLKRSFKFIQPDEICASASIFGAEDLCLSDEDIERLKKGEIILAECWEYSVYIGYKGKKPRGEYHSAPHYRCPMCNNSVVLFREDPKPDTCTRCGQVLDWSSCE